MGSLAQVMPLLSDLTKGGTFNEQKKSEGGKTRPRSLLFFNFNLVNHDLIILLLVAAQHNQIVDDNLSSAFA